MAKTLQEIAQRIEMLTANDDLDDDEVKELQDLNSQAAKMKAKQDGLKNVEAAKAAETKRIEEETNIKIDEAVKLALEKDAAKHRRLPSGEAPYQAQFSDTWRYDNLDRVELALLTDVQRAFAAKGVPYLSGDPIKPDPAAIKSLALRVAEFKGDNSEDGRKELSYMKGSFKAATGIDAELPAVEAALKGAKAATDPMYSAGAQIGSDWVGTAYATDLWRRIRAEARVVGKIPSEVIPDGYSNKTWPLESTDMTWYKVAEATASDATLKVPAATITASQMATANKNITLGKMGARGLYTQELDEDSLIRFAAQLRTQLEISGQEILESLVIDGDVETSGSKNINAIDTVPTATNYYLIFDGFRKLALVTNTANSLTAAGSLAIEDFLKILKLMGTAGMAGADPSKVAFIPDGNVHYALAQLPEVKTRDVNSAATVENGFVTNLWGVPSIPSWHMHQASAKRMANSAGKIDADTDSNNTLGAALAVRWDQWKLVYKRRMTMEVTRIANADSWEIVALTRLGLGYRDTEASAILYNIGV